MNYIRYENITGLHLEPTTLCNANCPMCARNFKGKVRTALKLTQLSLEDCKKIMPTSFIKQLKLVSLCGVFGDPILNKDIIDIINYFYECNNDITINLYTNGGVYNKEWWQTLAKSLKKGFVIFGIDGLGDTSALHRQNTNFDKVIENAKAFIDAGGNAEWDYLVFKHNEHQVLDINPVQAVLCN